MENFTAENWVALFALVGTVSIFGYALLLLLFDAIVRDSMFRRKHVRFRIVEHFRGNTLNPPGDRRCYSIEGKTKFGIWLRPECCLEEKNRYYETLEDARLYKKMCESRTNKYVVSHDFDDILSIVNDNGCKLMVEEKERCDYSYSISDTKDPKYVLVNITRYDDDFLKENDTNGNEYKVYKLSKKRLWWWHTVMESSYKCIIDNQIREYNTRPMTRKVIEC